MQSTVLKYYALSGLRRTSSQTGLESGESEIQILIGPNSTENSPQWFLFHYEHTGPHFRELGVVSGGEGGWGFYGLVSMVEQEGGWAPNKKILTFPTHFFSPAVEIIIISRLILRKNKTFVTDILA